MSGFLAWFTAPFNAEAFTLFGAPTTWGEVLGFATGAWCVRLVVRRSIWNWPVGIANNVFFLALFLNAGLYADSVLQVVFFTLGLYGWWAWLHGGVSRTPLATSRLTGRQWPVVLTVTFAATIVIATMLARWTPSTVPWADAVTTVLSLVAVWAQARRKLESWWFWIAADLVYVPLYQYKGLTLTAILYLGFLALCVTGLRAWSRDLSEELADGPNGTAAAGPAGGQDVDGVRRPVPSGVEGTS
jgi:nicotinamide mononucleotide transporter